MTTQDPLVTIEINVEGIFSFKIGLTVSMWRKVAQQVMTNPTIQALTKGAIPQPGTKEFAELFAKLQASGLLKGATISTDGKPEQDLTAWLTGDEDPDALSLWRENEARLNDPFGNDGKLSPADEALLHLMDPEVPAVPEKDGDIKIPSGAANLTYRS